jgi:hypothetical protein
MPPLFQTGPRKSSVACHNPHLAAAFRMPLTIAAENRLSLLNESTSHALIFEKISFGTKTFLKD